MERKEKGISRNAPGSDRSEPQRSEPGRIQSCQDGPSRIRSHSSEPSRRRRFGANVGGTTFQNVDLSSAKGLEVVNHFGRSAVSISTLYRSHGKIPESFLRGCRVPDEYIFYMRSLVANLVDVCTCFISYSTKNEAFAEGLHAELEKRQVRCWFAALARAKKPLAFVIFAFDAVED